MDWKDFFRLNKLKLRFILALAVIYFIIMFGILPNLCQGKYSSLTECTVSYYLFRIIIGISFVSLLLAPIQNFISQMIWATLQPNQAWLLISRILDILAGFVSWYILACLIEFIIAKIKKKKNRK